LGIVGLVGGYTYTAPPFQYKFGPVGIPLVFLLMGPLMVIGSFFAVSGLFDLRAVAASIPVGLLVAGILPGHERRGLSRARRVRLPSSRRAGPRGALDALIGGRGAEPLDR